MSELAEQAGYIGLTNLATLEGIGTVTATSLTLTDPELPLERWEAIGGMLGPVYRTTLWLVGDWLNFGEAVYGEDYAQGMEATGLTESRLRNIASVCRRVARSRRRATLTFRHHEYVSKFEPDEQTRWLGEAERNSWSCEALRAALRQTERVELPPPSSPQWSIPPGGTDDVDERTVETFRRSVCRSCGAFDDYESPDGSWVCRACGVVSAAPAPAGPRRDPRLLVPWDVRLVLRADDDPDAVAARLRSAVELQGWEIEDGTLTLDMV